MKRFIHILFIVFLLTSGRVVAQAPSADQKTLSLDIDNFNFLKNSELFNPILDGYSDVGYFLATRLNYHPTKKVTLSGGVFMLKYSGTDQFTHVYPAYSIRFHPISEFKMEFGSFIGGMDHGLVTPLYFEDYHWKQNPESGVRFQFQNKKTKQDLWLNWENHIERLEDYQEKFTVGYVGSWRLYEKENRAKVDFPLQYVFTHRGGQGNNNEHTVESIGNVAGGVNLFFSPTNTLLDSVTFSSYLVGFNDFSATKKYVYTKGFGWFSEMRITSKGFGLELGYWYGYHFLSIKGHPLFHSVSSRLNEFNYPTRKLLTGELHYSHTIYNGIVLRAGTRFFHDPIRHEFDYEYSLFLSVNLHHLRLL